MTDMQVFALYVLPVIVTALGWAVALYARYEANRP